jgi:hypothetical protein
MFLGMMALLLSSATAAPQGSGGACKEVEQQVLREELTEGKFESFRQVAAHRRAAKVDVLPSFPFCNSLSAALSELSADDRTTALLREGKMSQGDYIVVGWSLVVASNPEVFSLHHTGARRAIARKNRAFAKRHEQEIRSLLHAE